MVRDSAPWAKTIGELRELGEDDLIRQHDELAGNGAPGQAVGVDYYLQELARRDAARQTRRLVWLTWVITFLTAANVAVIVFDLLRS